MMYEVLWYEKQHQDDAETYEKPTTREFKTRTSALRFYNTYKSDKLKYGWWVTKRDANWYVVEDIVI